MGPADAKLKTIPRLLLLAVLACQRAEAADTTSVYVATRDGTRLAVDVHLPDGREPGEKLPALFELTRYWRSSECNGKVGAYGTSYTGTTAEFLAAVRHPAVKAVIPGWSDFDAYRSPARSPAPTPLPLVPGEPAELTFQLWPTSVLVRRGHRLRIAVAGADSDMFDRVPATGTPTITVFRSRAGMSFVDLPVIVRSE